MTKKPIAPPRTNKKLRISKYKWIRTVAAAPTKVPKQIARPRNFMTSSLGFD
jgi:hypothetical protein